MEYENEKDYQDDGAYADDELDTCLMIDAVL